MGCRFLLGSEEDSYGKLQEGGTFRQGTELSAGRFRHRSPTAQPNQHREKRDAGGEAQHAVRSANCRSAAGVSARPYARCFTPCAYPRGAISSP